MKTIAALTALAALTVSATASAAPGVVPVDQQAGSDAVSISYDSAGAFTVVTTTGDDEVWLVEAFWDILGGAEVSDCDVTDDYEQLIVRIDGTFHEWHLCEATEVEVKLGEGDDYIDAYFTGVPLVIYGEDGNDELEAGLFDDEIYGGKGNDEIDGYRGYDYIRGNKGNDVIRGGDDADDILGGNGTDTIEGNEGDDILAGGNGTDTITGGGGSDTIYRRNDSTCDDDGDTINSTSRDTVDPNCP